MGKTLEFTFDTQLLLEGENLPIDAIREHLEHTPPGDSLMVVGDEELIKIHFHTDVPWKVLEYVSQFGTIYDVVIENMEKQSEEFGL